MRKFLKRLTFTITSLFLALALTACNNADIISGENDILSDDSIGTNLGNDSSESGGKNEQVDKTDGYKLIIDAFYDGIEKFDGATLTLSGRVSACGIDGLTGMGGEGYEENGEQSESDLSERENKCQVYSANGNISVTTCDEHLICGLVGRLFLGMTGNVEDSDEGVVNNGDNTENDSGSVEEGGEQQGINFEIYIKDGKVYAYTDLFGESYSYTDFDDSDMAFNDGIKEEINGAISRLKGSLPSPTVTKNGDVTEVVWNVNNDNLMQYVGAISGVFGGGNHENRREMRKIPRDTMRMPRRKEKEEESETDSESIIDPIEPIVPPVPQNHGGWYLRGRDPFRSVITATEPDGEIESYSGDMSGDMPGDMPTDNEDNSYGDSYQDGESGETNDDFLSGADVKSGEIKVTLKGKRIVGISVSFDVEYNGGTATGELEITLGYGVKELTYPENRLEEIRSRGERTEESYGEENSESYSDIESDTEQGSESESYLESEESI